MSPKTEKSESPINEVETIKKMPKPIAKIPPMTEAAVEGAET